MSSQEQKAASTNAGTSLSAVGDATSLKGKFTPGSWRIGDAGHTVFGPPNGNPSPQTIANVKHGEDARFIVRACNSHADLLAACEAIAKLLGSMGPITGDPKVFKIRVDGAEYFAQSFRDLEAAIAKARQGGA